MQAAAAAGGDDRAARMSFSGYGDTCCSQCDCDCA